MLKWLLTLVLGLPLLVVIAGQLGLLRGKTPSNLGVQDGRLKPPSKTPNSVSSQTALWPGHPMADYAAIAPLPARGDATATMAALHQLVQGMPGAEVVKTEPGYVYATFTTRWLRFTDDAEFWFDPAAQALQVRSASRLGRKDFGVNRARIEAIRRRLTGTV